MEMPGRGPAAMVSGWGGIMTDEPTWKKRGCGTQLLIVLAWVVGLGCLALVIFAQGNT